jgi:hypothetical protein|tara:strand:- start:187 stop:372 length:186 start_codon:yes stop_codon:yes gene_type:complete
MSIESAKEWKYNPEYSYEANMANWIDAVHFERNVNNETQLTQEQAIMKFQEMYPRSEYGSS